MSIFIHDCIECQQNVHINQKIQTASIQTFSENASYFNYRISIDTKGPINPPSNQNSYIHVIVDAFSHFVVTVPIKQNNAQNAVNSLLHHWITKFGPPVYLVTDRGTEYINSEFANLCTTMGIRQSFLFLPNDNPKRPIIVPQEYLILNDDSLLQEDIPQNISDPLPPLQHIASQPLGDCEKSYFYAMTKKGYSNDEIIFIISHLVSLLTNGNHKEHKNTKTRIAKKTKNDIPQRQSFRPTDELQKYTEILNIIKPYHHPNRDILITIAEIVNTLEQARSIIQNIVFDTTRISQSA